MTLYRHAPLRYVLFALELSPASVLESDAALDQIHHALRDELPVREDGVGGLPLPIQSVATGTRFVDAAQHRAVLITRQGVTVDTTAYSTFGEFHQFLCGVLDAVAEVAPRRACKRLGLRYVDEIRVPGAVEGNVEQWSEWIDDALLAPGRRSPATGKREIAGAIEDTYTDGYGVRFAWQTGTGHAVEPRGRLVVPDPAEPGPYFVFDTDSYWNAGDASEPHIIGLGDPSLPDRLRRLHDPVRDIFEESISSRLRDEVLKPTEEPDVAP